MLYESESNDIQIACTGESLISRGLSKFREERFLRMVQMLRDADVAFTNAECLFHNYEDHPNTVAGGGSATGTYMASHPRNIKELQWAGIDVVACANNHGSDYGEGGVLTNIKYLDEAGMPHAGSGRNMADARSPVYLDTPKGRVALIAAADWGPRGRGGFPWPFPMGVMAGEQSSYSKGRPGYNLIRQRSVFTIDREAFDALRRLSKKLGFEEEKAGRHSLWGPLERDQDTDTVFHFMDTKFVLGDRFSLSTIANRDDVEANLKWVRDARRMADWVLVSFHNHGASPSPDEPSEHAKLFARACIEAGADVFIGHGPHQDRGIEIYQGKPIFHSLGDFILQNDTVQWAPYDAMTRLGLGWDNTPADFYDARAGNGTRGRGNPRNWESAVAMVSFKGGRLKEVRLHPVDLGMDSPRGQRGRPLLAEPGGEVNNRVLEKFQQMSKPFGTEIKIEDGVGVIRL
ncbi:MAG: CapA family protein [Betaproteobacteria bacterium]|nr:CapA family protein [Betaproteobacteria bacterium]